jgi:RNA polymerase sigma-70 factor (ECF subfamily)
MISITVSNRYPTRILFHDRAVYVMEGHRSPRSGSPTNRIVRDEARLVERAKRGDQKAISELYRSHVDIVHRYVYGRVGDAMVAEDLTAQVFLKALEGLPDYEYTGKPFVAWLYTIAYARTADYWRKQGRRQTVPLADTLPADTPQPEELLEAEAEWRTAIDLIAQLTDDQQDVLILRFIGDMSIAEVAETLAKSVGAVKALQHRALATIARLMERQTASSYYEPSGSHE